MRKVAIVVVPHPDDLDILASHIVQYLLKNQYTIYELLMTGGEYGVVNRPELNTNRIKGIPLRKIRKKENYNAKKIYGTDEDGEPLIKSLYVGYIDGHVPFNSASVSRLKKIFRKINPSIIVGPDPVYSLDWHADHMNTGRNVYFAVKSFPNLKLYLLYQTTYPNWFFPIQSWDVFTSSCLMHRSQFNPVSLKIMRFIMENFYYRLKRQIRGLRLVLLESKNVKRNFGHALLSFVSQFLTPTPSTQIIYTPKPSEFGLSVIPDDFMNLSDLE